MFYSKSTAGFYATAIHGARLLADGSDNPDCKIPADAVEITEAQHAALLEGQSRGQVIAPDSKGLPVLAPPKPPTFAALKAAALDNFRADREKMLNRLAGIGMAAQVGGDVALATAITAFRQGLLDLPSHASVTGATDIDALRLALKTRYAALLAATPATAKLAFKGVDA